MASIASRRIDVIKRQIEDGAAAFRAEKDKAHEAKFASQGKFTNWANIGHCNPTTHHRPKSEAEVVSIITEINRKGEKVRAAGAGASPNHICFTNGHMIHVKEHMNQVLGLDKAARTITVQGGATLKHIFATLDAAELMIPCVPSFLDTTIAGCIGTGTHSSGINVKSLHCYVLSMRVVTGSGALKVIDRNANHAEWAHWTCHLGVLGVITEVTLQADRKTLWRRISAPIPVASIASIIDQRVANNEYYRFWWTPHTNMCYEATIRPIASADEEQADTQSVSVKDVEAPGRHVIGDPRLTVGDANLDKHTISAITKALRDPHQSHQLWSQHQSEQQLIQDAANRVLPEPVNPAAIQHTVLERALYAATFTPALQPHINQAYQKTYLNQTQEQYGTAGEVMSFDCLFRQHTAEWAIDARHTVEALEAVRRIVLDHNLKVHFPVEFRFTDADDTTLSPCAGRKTCFIGIVMFRPLGREAPDTPKFLELFSNTMKAMGGRTHWAKYFHLNSADIAKMYGADKWQAFNQYRKECDPKGVFVNEWFSELLSQH